MMIMSSATQLAILQSVQGECITLTREGLSVEMVGVRAQTTDTMTAPDGTQTKFTTVDWLMTVEQTGELGKPRRGDTVTTATETFTVGHPNPNDQATKWHGSDKTAYRVHTIEE